MLNQTFTNKILLHENANIKKNVYFENIELKVRFQIGTRPTFHKTKNKYIYILNLESCSIGYKMFNKDKKSSFSREIGDFAT